MLDKNLIFLINNKLLLHFNLIFLKCLPKFVTTQLFIITYHIYFIKYEFKSFSILIFIIVCNIVI